MTSSQAQATTPADATAAPGDAPGDRRRDAWARRPRRSRPWSRCCPRHPAMATTRHPAARASARGRPTRRRCADPVGHGPGAALARRPVGAEPSTVTSRIDLARVQRRRHARVRGDDLAPRGAPRALGSLAERCRPRSTRAASLASPMNARNTSGTVMPCAGRSSHLDGVARRHHAGLDDRQVGTGAPALGEPPHPGPLAHPGGEGRARDPRPGHLEHAPSPTRQRSPTTAPSTSSPEVVRFSPNIPSAEVAPELARPTSRAPPAPPRRRPGVEPPWCLRRHDVVADAPRCRAHRASARGRAPRRAPPVACRSRVSPPRRRMPRAGSPTLTDLTTGCMGRGLCRLRVPATATTAARPHRPARNSGEPGDPRVASPA